MAAPIWSLLTSGSTATNAASFNTASVTLTAGRLYLLAVTTDGVLTSDRQVPTSVTHAAGTFTLADSQNVDGFVTQSLWRLIPASTQTGAVTIAHTAVTQDIEIWSLTEWTGFDAATPLGAAGKATATATATSSATAAAAVSAEPARIALHTWVSDIIGTAATATPASGWTEASDNPQNESGFSVSMQVQARSSDASTASATWSATSSTVGAMVFEVRSAPAASGLLFDSAIFSAPPFDTGSSGGGASVSGVTLTTNASLTFGGVSADSQVSGQTLTATASLISGTASASSSATANGATLTATASLIAGAASGTASASVSGITLTATTSLTAGALAASSSVSGLTLTATASLIAGTAAGGSASTVNGQTLAVSASIIAGSLAADSLVAGVTLTGGTVSLIPGTVAAASSVSGATFTATTAFFPGSASAGSSGATVNGQDLTTTVFFLAGLADNASLPRFPVRDRARNIVPRKYK